MTFNLLIFFISIIICASSDNNLKLRSNAAATSSSFKSAASARNQKSSSFLPFKFMKQSSSTKSTRKDLKTKSLSSHSKIMISKPEKPFNAMLKSLQSVQKDFQSSIDKIMKADDNMERVGVAVDMLIENKAALAFTVLCTVGTIVKILPSNPRKQALLAIQDARNQEISKWGRKRF